MRYLTLAKQAEARRNQTLSIHLIQFQQEVPHLEVRVAWLEESLWFVHCEADIQALVQVGKPRWQIWTLPELQGLLGACGTRVRSLHDAARAFESTPPR